MYLSLSILKLSTCETLQKTKFIVKAIKDFSGYIIGDNINVMQKIKPYKALNIKFYRDFPNSLQLS